MKMAAMLMLLPCQNCTTILQNRTFLMVNIKETFKELAARHHKDAIVEVDLAEHDTRPSTRVGFDFVVGNVLSSFTNMKYLRLQCVIPETKLRINGTRP